MLFQQDRLLLHFCIAVVSEVSMEMDWQKLLFHLPFSFPLPLTTEFLLLRDDAAYI